LSFPTIAMDSFHNRDGQTDNSGKPFFESHEKTNLPINKNINDADEEQTFGAFLAEFDVVEAKYIKAYPCLPTSSPQVEVEKFRFSIFKDARAGLKKNVYISKIDPWKGDRMTLCSVLLEKGEVYWPMESIFLGAHEAKDFFFELSKNAAVFKSAPAYHRLISDFCRENIPGQKFTEFPYHPKALTVAIDILSASAFIYTKCIEITMGESTDVTVKLKKLDPYKNVWIDWRSHTLSKNEFQWLYSVISLDESI